MIDIHDNVDRYDATRKKETKRWEKGETGEKREAKKHRAAMAAWSHRYPAESRDFRSTDLQVVSNPVELSRFCLSSSFHTLEIYRFALSVVWEIRGTKLPLATVPHDDGSLKFFLRNVLYFIFCVLHFCIIFYFIMRYIFPIACYFCKMHVLRLWSLMSINCGYNFSEFLACAYT